MSKPKQILVFIHVYKTAGVSMRDILMNIARSKSSSFGYATLVSGKLRDSADRNGRYTNHDYVALSDPDVVEYLRNNIDILGGHQSFDTANTIWPELPEESFQKFAFIRDPLHRYVSARIHTKKNKLHTLPDLLESIRIDILEEKRLVLDNVYWRYLATAEEISNPELENNQEKQNNILKMRFNQLAMVGLVERWSQSLKLLDTIWISEQKRPTQFDEMFSNKGTLPGNGIKGNLRQLYTRYLGKKGAPKKTTSTGLLILEIEKDKELYTRIVELLSYEQEIYDYALQIHMDQCKRAGIT